MSTSAWPSISSSRLSEFSNPVTVIASVLVDTLLGTPRVEDYSMRVVGSCRPYRSRHLCSEAREPLDLAHLHLGRDDAQDEVPERYARRVLYLGHVAELA